MQIFNYNIIMYENNTGFKRTLQVRRDRDDWGGSKQYKNIIVVNLYTKVSKEKSFPYDCLTF